jgi:hypothetical protein
MMGTRADEILSHARGEADSLWSTFFLLEYAFNRILAPALANEF